MAMNTASDLKKFLKTVYTYTDATSGRIIDSTTIIDDRVLVMMDEIESIIASYEADSKDIPFDIIVDVLREDGFFTHNLNTMIHKYKLIQENASAGLLLLDKMQKLIE